MNNQPLNYYERASQPDHTALVTKARNRIHDEGDLFTRSALFAVLDVASVALARAQETIEKTSAKPCDACNALPGQLEPPIVKGALDAQAEAETRMFALKAENEKLRAEVEACKQLRETHARWALAVPGTMARAAAYEQLQAIPVRL